MNKVTKFFKAIKTLGFSKLWYYLVYQLGLRTGHYRRATPSRKADFGGQPAVKPFQKFPKLSENQKKLVLAYADEIMGGSVRLFGGQPIPVDLSQGSSSKHWSALDTLLPNQDIKFIWEPARFGWAVTLARAFAFNSDNRYAEDFWEKTNQFLFANPPNLGYQWQSAQEVAIRLMVLVFCDRVFSKAPSSKPENRQRIWEAIIEHAQRIPPTLIYARAQNNNHLLSEAAGLLTAGLYLPSHPQAAKWRMMGWQWLNWSLQHQIDENGTYIQHSVNYHRLMLQIALFSDHMIRMDPDLTWPQETLNRLNAATRWLWALTDPESGKVPNLGANDGAYLFPLTSQPFEDYRPVVDAAAKAFLGGDVYVQPDLSEMADWFSLSGEMLDEGQKPLAADMSKVSGTQGRAFMHSTHYADRPSHADQLHVDLWHKGVNIALDPGTYRYAAASPWENALASTQVHNTLTINHQDQMLRAGRFLWLDPAQAQIISHEIDASGNLIKVTAEHDGYRKLGARHQRTLIRTDGGWTIKDLVLPCGKSVDEPLDLRLTWLLPDWKWTFIAENLLQLTGDPFSFQVKIEGGGQLNLFRAGERLHGSLPANPIWGWYAQNYGDKQPALMLVVEKSSYLPAELQSIFDVTN